MQYRIFWRLPDWNNRNNRDDYKGALWLGIPSIILMGAMTAYAGYVAFFYKTEWDEQLDQARKYGTEQVLESTHSRAVKSVDTINFANYVMIPQKTAERDSARYSRKISRFINLSGTDMVIIKWALIKMLLSKNPRFRRHYADMKMRVSNWPPGAKFINPKADKR